MRNVVHVPGEAATYASKATHTFVACATVEATAVMQRWINVHHRSALLRLCCNQQERARDVLEQQGGRTQW